MDWIVFHKALFTKCTEIYTVLKNNFTTIFCHQVLTLNFITINQLHQVFSLRVCLVTGGDGCWCSRTLHLCRSSRLPPAGLLLVWVHTACHNAADLTLSSMAPRGFATKSRPPGISKKVYRRMVRANQFLHDEDDEGVPIGPRRTKHYKGTQLVFDVGKAVVLDTPHHTCCKHGRLCFDAKGRLSGPSSNLIPCPAMHCASKKNMEMRFLHKRFTQNPFTKGDGPDLVEHVCSGRSGCGARFIAWDFILGGENVTSILVRKDRRQFEHMPGHWGDWMLNVQETLEAEGDLLLKFQTMDYRLHMVKGIQYRLLFMQIFPRVRSINRVPGAAPVKARGTKRPREHSDSTLSAFSPYSKFCTLSPGQLGLQRHLKFAARKIVFPIGRDCFEVKGEFLEDVIIPSPGIGTLEDSIIDAGADVGAEVGRETIPPTPQNTLAELSLPPLPSPSGSEIPDFLELELPPPVPTLAASSGAGDRPGDSGDEEDMFASSDEGETPLTSTRRDLLGQLALAVEDTHVDLGLPSYLDGGIGSLLAQAAGELPGYLHAVEDRVRTLVLKQLISLLSSLCYFLGSPARHSQQFRH